MVYKVGRFVSPLFNYIPQCSGTAKKNTLISFIAVGALAFFSLIIRKWMESSPPKLDVHTKYSGELNGNIIYSPLLQLNVKSKEIQLTQEGLISGQAEVTNGSDTYVGEFEKGQFKNGLFVGFIAGKKYSVLVKNFKFEEVLEIVRKEKNPVDATQFIELEVLSLKTTFIRHANYGNPNFAFKGDLKGKIYKGDLQIEGRELHIDEKGISGNVNIFANAHHYKGHFYHGRFKSGRFEGKYENKQYEVHLMDFQVTSLDCLDDRGGNIEKITKIGLETLLKSSFGL